MAGPTIALIHGAFGDASSGRPVFGTADGPVAPELNRSSCDRASSTVTEVQDASDFVVMSQPDIAAGIIRHAVTGPCRKPGGLVTRVV
jgi:hypothetical protein